MSDQAITADHLLPSALSEYLATGVKPVGGRGDLIEDQVPANHPPYDEPGGTKLPRVQERVI